MEVYYVQDKTSMIINAILLIVIGVLFIWDKDVALEWGFIIAGAFMIISGLIPMIAVKDVDIMGLILIVLGIILILVPKFFAGITIVFIGIIAIILGVIILFSGIKTEGSSKAFNIVVGALILLAGILTFIGEDIAFIVFGAMLLVAGIINAAAIAKA